MQVKTIKDYYDIIQEKFPQVDMADIKRILQFGWKSVYLHNSYGGDVSIRDGNLWCYMGFLPKDSIKYFNKYVKKLCLKIRVLYKRRKIPWDGYYYFALTTPQYEKYQAQKHKKGRPKKYFNFENLVLYKILDECKVREHSNRYIFRIPYLSDIGLTFYLKEARLENPELIIEREPLKLKDILVTNNNYDVI